MAILLPVLVVYGITNSKSSDLAPLNLQRHEVAVLVGYAGGEVCRADLPCDTRFQRSYIVFPRVLSNGATMEVNENNGTVTVSQYRGGAVLTLAVWLICVYGLWYFWIRLFLKRRNSKST